jgi:hypothetical protein
VMCGVLPWIKPWSAAPGQNVSQNVGHKSPVLRMQRHPAVVHPQSGLGNAKVPNVQARPSKPTAMWARASSAGSGAPRSSWRVRADRTRGRGATSPLDRCVRFFTARSKAPEAADYLCGLALAEPATIAAWGAAPHGTRNRHHGRAAARAACEPLPTNRHLPIASRCCDKQRSW